MTSKAGSTAITAHYYQGLIQKIMVRGVKQAELDYKGGTVHKAMLSF